MSLRKNEQKILADIHKAVNPDHIELESNLALIAVVGRGMKSTRGTAGRIFSALAHAHINVKMIDQGSSELNIIIGVRHDDFKNAIRALYEIFSSLPRYKNLYPFVFHWITIIGRIYQEKFVKKSA